MGTRSHRGRGLLSDWRPNWPHVAAYGAMHLGCLTLLWVRPSLVDLLLCALLFALRVLGISVGWHRYLAHRTFKTSRILQFLLVLLGSLSGMKGGLWFADHHRLHHGRADRPDDVHSPLARGFAQAYALWFLDRRYCGTDYRRIAEWVRYPELVWLNENGHIVSAALVLVVYAGFGLSGLLWGYLLSTLLVWHTFQCIGTLGHGYGGARRFATPDNSQNRPVLAFFSFGEGWHNNHHHVPDSACLSAAWWQLDLGWLVIKVLRRAGLVWDVRVPTSEMLDTRSTFAQRHLMRLDSWLDGLRQELQPLMAAPKLEPLLRVFQHRCRALLWSRPIELNSAVMDLRREVANVKGHNFYEVGRTDRAVLRSVRNSPLSHLLLKDPR